MDYNFKKKNIKQWAELLEEVFGQNVPDSHEWKTIDEIVKVLNTVGKFKGWNHMFLPGGGGYDLESCSLSHEQGCIELNTDSPYIVKPKSLTFELIDFDLDKCYFRLELEESESFGFTTREECPFDKAVELNPHSYIPCYHWDNDMYNGEPLPKSARVVKKYLRGSIVIFMKASEYNSQKGKYGDSYNGQHTDMNADKFKHFILTQNCPN
eukprot:TRINITY_DN80325_c0_g1_i1.p1 TRINITY_DN80325_c0_g1~~TRINITY_DN80325_c0_g1_i1.p1  ORF type:complete len:210 (+),score=30.61 TRINITY_DN80325_c0_g1_i1:193-822(+)